MVAKCNTGGAITSRSNVAELGFADGVLGRESQTLMRRDRRAYDYGFLAGRELRLRYSGKAIDRFMRNAARLQARAAKINQMLSREHNMAGLSRDEPCVDCAWIGICGATAMTCSAFRSYVSPSGTRSRVARVPDRDWHESFYLRQES